MRAGLVAGASVMAVPGPSTDPWCRGPPLGSGGSMRVGRMHGVHGRPRGSPVRRADRQPLWQCRRRVVHRGLEGGTREPWGPLGPGPCDPGRDSPDRVTMRSQASPLGDRPPDPRPSRHRMETTAQGSSPRPTINHCLKNLYHSKPGSSSGARHGSSGQSEHHSEPVGPGQDSDPQPTGCRRASGQPAAGQCAGAARGDQPARPPVHRKGRGAGLRGGRHVLVDEGPRPCGPYPGE